MAEIHIVMDAGKPWGSPLPWSTSGLGHITLNLGGEGAGGHHCHCHWSCWKFSGGPCSIAKEARGEISSPSAFMGGAHHDSWIINWTNWRVEALNNTCELVCLFYKLKCALVVHFVSLFKI